MCQSGEKFKDTVKLANPENHRSDARICDMTYTCRVIANLVLEFPNFYYRDNKGSLG